MMGQYQSHAHIGVKKIVNFRKRWANKSDTIIKAALNHFWSKQIHRSAADIHEEKDRLRK
ncbi:hypothetical protein ABIE91_004151 [Bradyrhizobium elkanii]|jgi:hypothetical protein